MGYSHNSITLVGRLTKDPEFKNIKEGTDVAKFTLAVGRGFKKDETDFINCVAWNKIANTINIYTRKGSPILVVGRLQISNYENKDGVKVWKTEVIVEKMTMLGSKKEENKEVKEAMGAVSANTAEDEKIPF